MENNIDLLLTKTLIEKFKSKIDEKLKKGILKPFILPTSIVKEIKKDLKEYNIKISEEKIEKVYIAKKEYFPIKNIKAVYNPYKDIVIIDETNGNLIKKYKNLEIYSNKDIKNTEKLKKNENSELLSKIDKTIEILKHENVHRWEYIKIINLQKYIYYQYLDYKKNKEIIYFKTFSELLAYQIGYSKKGDKKIREILLKKSILYLDDKIFLDPTIRLNREFLDEISRKKDALKTMKKYGLKYFKSILK